MYNNEIEIYKKQVIDKLHILIGAMILDGYGEDERDALYNLLEDIESRVKELSKINLMIQEVFENCDKKSLLVD